MTLDQLTGDALDQTSDRALNRIPVVTVFQRHAVWCGRCKLLPNWKER